MNRRSLLPLLFAAAGAGLRARAQEPAVLRGKLANGAGAPVLETSEGALVRLDGDEETNAVLRDARLNGAALEVTGQRPAPDLFQVGPIYKKSVRVERDGRRLLITYWCEVCAIRSYTPGICACCQEETELDLRPAGSF
jgi:hypothetical protein